MIVSKYFHSCLLIKEKEKTILIDPGIFTYQEKILDTKKLSSLDYILITHEHPDHFHLPFIKDLVSKFPTASIRTTESIVNLLQNDGIHAQSTENKIVTITPAPHERVFDREVPQNVLFKVFGRLAHPGDSLSFSTTAEIFAMPVLGPSWMITQATEKALLVKPKIVLPIHDYHLKDGIRREFYKRLEEYFHSKGIIFKSLEAGDIIEV